MLNCGYSYKNNTEGLKRAQYEMQINVLSLLDYLIYVSYSV